MIYSSNFLPCLAYFAGILQEPEIKINIGEQYRKQSYRTRAYILGPHQVETLNIPVLNAPNNEIIKEIQIDNRTSWQRSHFKTISNCYKKSTYFEFYEYLFEPLFIKTFSHLIDFNHESLSICLKILKINKTICQGEFSYFENKNDFISFNAKNRLELPDYFVSRPYFQNFGNKFEQNLSIIDLLFSKGPESVDLLKSSIKSIN
ncbi:WbqC family protein [Lacihabitans sp. LS3-19]|uniref:WbqC family protein n=1 Tax=Lacihabitans sp. LS3-19 TaxID=2487335 RepID=UPI0020CCCEB4|nr:WbqC family protein [Lacihabitans sp. LS3-19]